jgi:hypothetical protein
MLYVYDNEPDVGTGLVARLGEMRMRIGLSLIKKILGRRKVEKRAPSSYSMEISAEGWDL